VEALVVAEMSRRRGVRSALLNAIERWGTDRGATRMVALPAFEGTGSDITRGLLH